MIRTPIALGAILWLSCLAAWAGPTPVPAVPEVAAASYLLQDFHSAEVLAGEEADARVEPASLTKIMTAYVVFDELANGHIDLQDRVRVSEKAWRMPGSRMFIEVDTSVSVKDLLHGMIVQSGNDASVALAEHVAGSEQAFAQLMNQHAARLGLAGTHFVNSTGLPDPEHYTTARDMALLSAALIRDFPEHYPWHAIREFTYNDIRQFNRNRLLWQDESVDGIKTGHTESAGYCLVASAEREGMRLISVVMGTESEKARTGETRKLLSYGFRFFETHRLYKGAEPLAKLRVWKGEREQVPVGLADELYVTVPRGRYQNLKASMDEDQELMAPVVRGQPTGRLTVTLDGEPVLRRPLVALASVGAGSLWRQLLDHVRLMLP